VEEALKNEGFDVIVFIPSKEEDESRITCGNAILAYDNLAGVVQEG
jgi:23S rRNA (adenine2503-C2)-methyltransferase